MLMVFLCSVLCFLERIDDAIRRDETRDWLVVFIEQHNVYISQGKKWVRCVVGTG